MGPGLFSHVMAAIYTSWALNVPAAFAKAKSMRALHHASIDWASLEIHVRN
jgi:hypothetical protein